MSQSSGAPAEFWNLMNDALNGTLSESDVVRLELWLDGDRGLQKLYRDYFQLHVNLDTDTRSQRAIDTFLNGHEALQAFLTDDEFAASKAVDREAVQKQVRSVRNALWCGLLACAAAISFFALTVAMRHGDDGQAVPSDNDLANSGKAHDTVTVRLSSDDSRYVSIGDVGSIYIQGPAHLELIGISRARLHEGRIKVRITDPRGHGFVVETPQGNVTDLGTEFGVDVTNGIKTGVVVFEGAVNLEVPANGPTGVRVERLLQGEGLSVGQTGRMDRIMSIVTGNMATFQQRGEVRSSGLRPVIVDVFDNIRARDLKKFYEIVPGGLHEDALAYVDRPAHDWSGVDHRGIPKYLIGADYVKPFNNDKMRSDVQISVTLSCPARLFVFADDRVIPPDWLRENFRDTGDDIGHDVGAYIIDGVKYFKLQRGSGPGKSIDSKCSIWEQVVPLPATIELGPNSGSTELTAMYGIAAIPLEAANVEKDASQDDLGESLRNGGGPR